MSLRYCFNLLLVLSIDCIKPSSSQPTTCLVSFPGPEILYNLYACSIVLDWDPYITQECRLSATSYEVDLQHINESTDQTNSTRESFILPKKIPGQCSVNTKCYVRMRFWLNDTASWSKYSLWTTLSNNYEATRVCVMNGTSICFPINANGTTQFIINQQQYFFSDIYSNSSVTRGFNVTYIPSQSRICFSNIRTNIRLIEFCHVHCRCIPLQLLDEGELVIDKKIEIDVRSTSESDIDGSECSISDTPPRITSVVKFGAGLNDSLSVYAQQDHCVVVDFTGSGMAVQSWINNITLSLQNVCFMLTESEQGIQLSSQSTSISLKVDDATDHMRIIAQYQQNSSYYHVGYFEIPPRTMHNNENITIILAPCTSTQHPPTSNTPTGSNTPELPHNSSASIIVGVVLTLVGISIITILLVLSIWWYKRRCEKMNEDLNPPPAASSDPPTASVPDSTVTQSPDQDHAPPSNDLATDV